MSKYKDNENIATMSEEELEKREVEARKSKHPTLAKWQGQAVQILTTLVVIAVIGVSAFIPLTMTKQIDWGVFGTRMALSVFLAIYGLPAGQSLGNHVLKNIAGLYRYAKARFLRNFTKVDNYDGAIDLDDWLSKYQEQKRDRVYRRILSANRIKDDRVLYLEEKQLIELLEGAKEFTYIDEKGESHTVAFLQISESQLKVITDMKAGYPRIKVPESSFFLSSNAISSSDPDAQASESADYKRKTTAVTYTSNIIQMVIISLFLAFVSKDEFTNLDQAEAWFLFLSRLMVLGSSIVKGYLHAHSLNVVDVANFDYKSVMLNKYYIDKSQGRFVPENTEEKAKSIINNNDVKIDNIGEEVV